MDSEAWTAIAVLGGSSVLIAASVVVTVVSRRRATGRATALRRLARTQGWLFLRVDPFLPSRWDGHPFDKGHNRLATNVLTGRFGAYTMIACDYDYTRDGSDGAVHEFAVCALEMPGVLPELHLAPEDVLSRIGQTAGMRDIEMESEDFNRRYRVRCHDPKFATDVLTPRTMEALLQIPDFSARFIGTDAVCVTKGRLEPDALLERLAGLAALVDGVPAFVWERYGPPDHARPPL